MAKKYIDAELLRKKVEKYYDEYRLKFNTEGDPYYLGVADGLDVAKRVIDSLQQDQPLPGTEELKEGIPGKDFIPVEWVDACEEYGIWKIVKVEQPCEDFEKYASRAGFDYVDDIEQKYPRHRWNDHDVEFAYRDGIIAGAEWQRQRTPMPEDTILFNKGVAEGRRLERQDMLKDAVEGTVCKDKKRVWIELIPNALPDYEDIEPVKCVVIKEDKK